MTWSFINAISGKLANKWFPKDEIARATAFGQGFQNNLTPRFPNIEFRR